MYTSELPGRITYAQKYVYPFFATTLACQDISLTM